MFTLSLATLYLGFMMIYSTSKHAQFLASNELLLLLQKKSKLSKYFGTVLFLIAIILFICNYGLASGALFFFVALMTLSSTIIILQPLHIFNWKTLVFTLIITSLIELL